MKKLFIITVFALMCVAVRAQSPTFSVYPAVTSYVSNDSAVIFGQAFNPVPGDTLLVWAVMSGGAYTADTIMVTAAGATNVNVPVHGLVANTTYTVHLCGTLMNTGTSGCSPTPYPSFTTWYNPTYAYMSYITPFPVTTSTIKVKFHYDFGYGALTNVRVNHGPNALLGTYTPWLMNLTGSGDTAITISGLSPATLRYLRLESQSSFAIYNTATTTATTLAITYCDINATAANITGLTPIGATFGWNATLGTASTAQVWGSIYQGAALVTSFPMQFVTTSGLGTFGSYAGLMPNTAYTYKVFMQDIYGIDSVLVPFTTPQIPPPSNYCDTTFVDYFSAGIMFNVAPGSTYPGSAVMKAQIIATCGALTLQDTLFGPWTTSIDSLFSLSGLPAAGHVFYTITFTNAAGVTSVCNGDFYTDNYPPPADMEVGLPATGVCQIIVPITLTVHGAGTVTYAQYSTVGPTGPWTDSMLVCSNCPSGTLFATIDGLNQATQHWVRFFNWVGVPYNRSYSNVVGPVITNNGSEPEVQIYSVLPGIDETQLVISIGGSGYGYESQVTANVYKNSLLVASPMQSVGTCNFSTSLVAQLLEPCTNYDIEVVITSNAGSASDTRTGVSTGCIGIDQETSINFTMYPNPASSFITIAGIEQVANPMIRLIGMDGRVSEIRLANNQIAVDTLPSGIYVAQIFDGPTIVFSQKIIVQH